MIGTVALSCTHGEKRLCGWCLQYPYRYGQVSWFVEKKGRRSLHCTGISEGCNGDTRAKVLARMAALAKEADGKFIIVSAAKRRRWSDVLLKVEPGEIVALLGGIIERIEVEE